MGALLRFLCFLLLIAVPTQGQAQEIVLFDEGGTDHREASAGQAHGGDELALAGPQADRLPLDTPGFESASAGLLRYRHVSGGGWTMTIEVDGAPVDLSDVDSLVLYLNAPATLPGADLPRLALEDADGDHTAALPLRLGDRIGLDARRTGFEQSSQTNARFTASYIPALPAGQPRPGYPEDLLLRFSDEFIDTSTAAIGLPAVPVRFTVETEAGHRHAFRFRDTDASGTLDVSGEYVEVLLPEAEGSTRLRPAWRIEVTVQPTHRPGSGDVYRLAVDHAGVDGDPATWQRLAVALADFGPPGAFDPARVAAIRFGNDAPPTSGTRTLWFDRVLALDADASGTPPPAPGNVEAQAGDSSVVLRWQAVPGAAGYHVYRQDAPDAPYERLTNPATDVPHFADLDAVNGRTYTYVVRTIGADGRQSADAGPVTATPEAGLPDAFIDLVAETAFGYFWHETNPANGLTRDRTSNDVASIAAVGFGLSAITVGIDRGWISREDGVERVLRTLEFFWNAPQSETDPLATGYKGFFYHFLDMNTGQRAWNCELSTIDTALLLGGVLHAREYFDGDTPAETRIRQLSDAIYGRVDWRWAQPNPPLITAGWFPERGFIEWDWRGYNEANILYLLALGSPTFPVEPAAWTEWTRTYRWATHYGYSFVEFPPLFGHQYSHIWYDFRDIRDAYMREKDLDYFENSRRATLAQRAYHIDNPNNHPNYGPNEWGLTASDIPGGYLARGAPPAENDDGTLAPTAPGGSFAFTPSESAAVLRHLYRTYRADLWGPYGFRDAFNVGKSWFATDYLGIDQGPILLMIENARTGRIWDVFMRHDAVRRGLLAAGFAHVATTLPDPALPPDTTAIENFPNPFADSTQIRYVLPEPGYVVLSLHDILGREIARLTDGIQAAGTHTVRFEATGQAAGIYFYRLKVGETVTTGKIVLLR